MKIGQNINRFYFVVYISLSVISLVGAQDFNIYQNILGSEVAKLEVGNLDGNPLEDVVFNNSNSINVALNIGEDFDNVSSVEIFQSANEIQQFQIIDSNGDGYDDIIFLEKDYGSLTLLENDGSGDFIASILIDTCQVREFVLVDIDGDSDMDVLGMSQGDDFVSQNLLFYKQNANKEFEESILFSAEAYFVSDYILPVDIDEDGDLDIFFFPFYSGFSSGQFAQGPLLLYTQSQPGIFSMDTLKSTGQAVVNMQIADMNDDDMLDLVFTTKDNTSGYDLAFVAFQENNLNFDFNDISPDQQIFNKDGVALELLDINQDGNLDVIYEAKGIRVALNQGNKSFINKQLIFNENDLFTREFQVLDFNKDGLEDILATFNSTGRANAPKKWFWYKMTDRDLLTFENQGELFQEAIDEYSLWTVVDLDQNGYLDVIADGGSPFIFENLNMTSAISDLTSDDVRITVFPNPTSNTLNVQIEDNALTLEKVVLFTSTGQRIYEGHFSKQINVDWLENGTYLLQLFNDKGEVYVRKITK